MHMLNTSRFTPSCDIMLCNAGAKLIGVHQRVLVLKQLGVL
jgi:hypothetical protein